MFFFTVESSRAGRRAVPSADEHSSKHSQDEPTAKQLCHRGGVR